MLPNRQKIDNVVSTHLLGREFSRPMRPLKQVFLRDLDTTIRPRRFLCDSYLTRTALRFGRCLLSSHVLLRSRFAHALRSLVSQRKRRATAHNRVVLGNQNPHVEHSRDQSLGDALRAGVLGNPAILVQSPC